MSNTQNEFNPFDPTGMLKEMRDAAGDSGEFYTPRPVIKLMVALVDPKLGEKVLDPACGTGGFLVEAYEHIRQSVNTPEEREKLQRDTLFGGEAKSLPYLLGEMNMLLHGVEVPNIDYGNSLAVKLTELGDRDRVDAILTNPPFGGEEEASIKTNFPADKQTSETALLFLQLIMRLLRRPGHPAGAEGGRAAVVVPNGTLFGDGVCARIKEQLLTEFNLHTVVRLPNGVFAPYTSIPTNVLFFDRTGPTKDIWYYEHPLPEGRKNYTKTKPMRFEEFADFIEWYGSGDRDESDTTWKVSVDEILKYDKEGNLVSANLDLKNPNSADALEHRPPEELVADILEKERRILELVEEIREALVE
jgi:type I restriction enzyme M protein